MVLCDGGSIMLGGHRKVWKRDIVVVKYRETQVSKGIQALRTVRN